MSRKSYVAGLNKKVLLAGLVAALLCVTFQMFPYLNQMISFGVMMLVPTMYVFVVVPSLVAAALSVAIAMGYSLIDVRNNVFSAFLGFSVSYFAVSLVAVIMEQSAFIEFILNVFIAAAIFTGAIVIGNKLPVFNRTITVVGGVIVVALAVFLAPIATHPIEAQRATVKQDGAFTKAVNELSFVPYYPTYSSSIYPLSEAKLNGYDGSSYSNETVTFLLGKAQVKQGAYLSNQEKLMNFSTNCTIYKLWFAMGDKSGLSQDDIEHGEEYPQKCNLIATTPTGKKVYFNGDGQWTRFYVLLGKTNFIIDFDDINGRKYDPTQLNEIIKIIDSLQPLEKTQLKRGNSYGNGFSS